MTTINCGFFCKSNESGICGRNEITIGEDRRCDNMEYDVSKALCSHCEYQEEKIDEITGCWYYVCTIDDKITDDESMCTNGQFSFVG